MDDFELILTNNKLQNLFKPQTIDNNIIYQDLIVNSNYTAVLSNSFVYLN